MDRGIEVELHTWSEKESTKRVGQIYQTTLGFPYSKQFSYRGKAPIKQAISVQ